MCKNVSRSPSFWPLGARRNPGRAAMPIQRCFRHFQHVHFLPCLFGCLRQYRPGVMLVTTGIKKGPSMLSCFGWFPSHSTLRANSCTSSFTACWNMPIAFFVHLCEEARNKVQNSWKRPCGRDGNQLQSVQYFHRFCNFIQLSNVTAMLHDFVTFRTTTVTTRNCAQIIGATWNRPELLDMALKKCAWCMKKMDGTKHLPTDW